jgi:hypothetical protein
MLPIRRKIKRFKTQTISLKQPQIITELEKNILEKIIIS